MKMETTTMMRWGTDLKDETPQVNGEQICDQVFNIILTPKGKKKKRKNNKRKKKVQNGKQTTPPRVHLFNLFPNEQYPEGQIVEL